MLAAYQVLSSCVYAILRLGHALLPPLRERLAPRLALDLEVPDGGPLVHFHASSVGEISSIAPVVWEFKREFPDYARLVTTMTRTGSRRAKTLIPDACVTLIPFDMKPAVSRFVGAMRPRTLIIAETELWPNLLREAKRRGAALVLVNGRISAPALKRYERMRPLVASMLSQFDLMLMRSEENAERIRSLGADPERVHVSGNTKYDVLPGRVGAEGRAALRRRLGLAESRQVITLGSAREGESEVLLKAVRRLDSDEVPAVVLAPRHLENVGGLEATCSRMGFSVSLSSGCGDDTGGPGDVIIVNEMGGMLEYYAMSDIALVGGTLRPFGGHNPLEPASQGAAVVLGPHRDNIVDDVEYLMSMGAAVMTDEDDLADLLERLLSDRAGLAALGERGAAAVEAGKGAAARCVAEIKARGILK